MFRTYNLPWVLKVYIILQNVYAHYATPHSETTDFSENACIASILRVFIAHTGLLGLVAAPAAFVSVLSRRQTLEFQCHVLAHMTVHTGVVLLLQNGMLTCEHTCYMLQFCSCYIFYFIWQQVHTNKSLVVAVTLVLMTCCVGMSLLPLCFSKAWKSNMHVNQYALAIIFSGEASGLLAYCVHTSIETIATLGATFKLYQI